MPNQKDFRDKSEADTGARQLGFVEAIYRYPIKGMTPERLPEIALTPHQTLPNDRAYAIENGTRDFDAAAPRYFPKIKYLMLMRNERLAALKSHFDDVSGMLAIFHNKKEMVRGELTSKAGRTAIEDFLQSYMQKDLRGPARIVHAEGFSFSDIARKVVSLINLASLRTLEQAFGRKLDPLRFRANIYLDGLEPWEEFGWVDRDFLLGEVSCSGIERITRCAAVDVDPQTASRDANIPAFLLRTYGHADFGIYADVTSSGMIRERDRICLS